MERRTLRERKVSQRMAVVDEGEKKRAVAARLEALENDTQGEDPFAVDSGDEEFILRDDSDEGEDEAQASGRKRKKKGGGVGGGMRKTRGMLAEKSKGGPKSFKDWLDEAELDRLPPGVPSYLTAAVGSPRTTAARKLCSVCGDLSGYTCTRCGSRYCCRKCYTVHTDTRCLKFMA